MGMGFNELLDFCMNILQRSYTGEKSFTFSACGQQA